MEETLSGFKVRGSWGEVVEHGERITRAMRDAELSGDAVEEWDEWRPKHHERLGEDVNEKTAEQAAVSEGRGERAGKEPEEDLQTAGEKLSESYEKLDTPEEAVDKWGESIEYVARAADSAGRKALRAVEGTVYRKVMTQIAPYYFDNELVSANVQRIGSQVDPEYVFEVTINDDDVKEEISALLQDYDDRVDRWHVDTPKETEAAAAAEGVEAPDEETEGESKSTTN